MANVRPILDDRGREVLEIELLDEHLAGEDSSISLEPDLRLIVQPHNSAAGRLFDVAIAVAILIIFLPVFVLLAIATRVDSPGPILFRQPRSGLSGAPFTILKFRTMRDGGDAALATLLETDETLSLEFEERAKLAADPRVSRLGRILRPLGLDEIPQLINVLRGEMSLVGPRPIALGEEVRYGDKAPLLWSVKPGLTGVWQLNGRNDTTYEERVDFDMSYVHAKSVRFDAELLAKTVVKFLRGRLHGGY